MEEQSLAQSEDWKGDEMATEHGFIASRSYKKMKALGAQWIASKESGERDPRLAAQLRQARANYRRKHRPAPEAGVTMQDPVKIR